MNSHARTRGASTPAYYLGRPATFWLAALAPATPSPASPRATCATCATCAIEAETEAVASRATGR